MKTRPWARRLLQAGSLALLVSFAAPVADSGAQAGGKAPPTVIFTGGFVYHSESIPAGATGNFKVTCPPPMTAMAGGVASGDPRVLSLLSVKAGASAWSFGFRNTDTKNAITVVVVVTCAKPTGVPAAFLVGLAKKIKQKQKQAQVKTVPPGAGQVLLDQCPKGSTAIGESVQSGGGVAPKSAQVASLTNIGGADVTSVTLGRRTVSVGLRNPGPTEVTASVRANCLPRRFTFHGRERSIQVNRATFGENIGGHGSIVSGGCPGQLPLSAGFSVPADGRVGFLGTGFRTGSLSASWAFSNATGQSQPATVSLVCTRGKAKFADGLPPSQSIDTMVGPITING